MSDLPNDAAEGSTSSLPNDAADGSPSSLPNDAVSGSAPSLELVAASLRADAQDLVTLTRVLTSSLGDALPDGMVEVERQRSMADRLAGREGEPVAVTVTTTEAVLQLRHGKRGPQAQVQQVVRGVVIKRREVDLDEWLQELARILRDRAERDARTRQALEQLLGGTT